MIFDEDVKFCASLLQKSDPQKFRSIMAAPEKLRPYYFVIFAFNVEISRTPYITKEPMIAEMRLQWWLDTLDEIIAGKVARKHSVATSLSKCIGKIHAKELKIFVNARRWDVYSNKFVDFSELKKYLFDTTAILFRVAAGYGRGKNEKAFQNACMAIALANYLMATPGLKKAGKMPISGMPTNEIEEQCKISLENLEIAKIKWSDFTEQERWVLFTGWKSKKILSEISKNLDKLDSTVAKLENRRMTFTFVMKAFLKTF